jgi:nucleotide-binding universal stress UspA family protein
MNHMTDHIIFATNFSDASHAAIPTVTRWVDAHNARLTLLHVYNPARTLHRDAEAQLRSFYAEADNYPNCRRVLLAGNVCSTISAFCKRERDGLLFMPPSDRTSLPRPFHISTRARLLETLEMPIWTLGKATLNTGAAVAGRNIAVALQNLDEPTGYLAAAASHALRHNSTLHLLHVVPETTEGTLITALHSDAPLGIESALDRISNIAAELPAGLKVEVHVRMGQRWRELKSLLHECDAELLMVGRSQTLYRGLFRSSIDPMLNDCNIPIVCLPEHMDVSPRRSRAPYLAAA